MRSAAGRAGLALVAAALVAGAPLFGASLPQEHPYQKTLRDYLATLGASDFAVEIKPLAYVEEHFADLDTLGRYWMFCADGNPHIPDSSGIRVSAEHFTLAAIEADDSSPPLRTLPD